MIVAQPNGITAGYRPIIIDVELPYTTVVAYCDVYFNGVFYRTLTRTAKENATIYRFDLQDLAQEFLRSDIPLINSVATSIPTRHFADAYCIIRVGALDSNGFVKPEITGLQTLTFSVLNATLQHENAQDLKTHLQTINNAVITGDVLPLTHRPAGYKLCLKDNDFYSVWVDGNVTACSVVEVLRADGTIEVYDGCPSLPPNVYLYWFDGVEQTDKVCAVAPCTVWLKAFITGTSTTTILEKSTDNGITWTQVLTTTDLFLRHDFTLSNPSEWYRATTTDSFGQVAVSNILKITEQQSVNTAPTVAMVWLDAFVGDKTTTSVGNFPFAVQTGDAENNILSIIVYKRENNGIWQVDNSDIVDTIGITEWKAVVTDAGGLVTESNILTVTYQNVQADNVVFLGQVSINGTLPPQTGTVINEYNTSKVFYLETIIQSSQTSAVGTIDITGLGTFTHTAGQPPTAITVPPISSFDYTLTHIGTPNVVGLVTIIYVI